MGSSIRDRQGKAMNESPKLRVMHVITGLGQGGAEAVLFRLATYPGQAIEHTVVSLTDFGAYGERLRATGVTVHSLGMARGRVSLGGIFTLRALMRQARPDVVQTWMYHADLIGGLVARLAGIRAVAWCIRNSGAHLERSSRSARVVLKLCAMMSRWVPAAIICAAQDAASRHVRLGYHAHSMTVIPNGYDLSRFTPDADAGRRMREQWGIAENALKLGSVARWDPLKDHANLLNALSIVRRGDEFPTLRCVLIGRDMTVDNVPLNALISALGLRDNVVLAGPSDTIPAVMNGLDLHVLSSCAEGFPNVVAEAMACGTPCVVTNVGDAGFIVGDTATVVPPEQPQALAEGIVAMLRAVVQQGRDRVGQAGRDRVLSEFDLARMVQAYATVWSRISGVPL